MYRSKARLTEEESAELEKLAKEWLSTPIMKVGPVDLHAGARRRFIRRIDELAGKYGLAEQPGEWGFDVGTRQFLSNYPIVEPEGNN